MNAKIQTSGCYNHCDTSCHRRCWILVKRIDNFSFDTNTGHNSCGNFFYNWNSLFCCCIWIVEWIELGLDYYLDIVWYSDHCGYRVYCYRTCWFPISNNYQWHCHLLSISAKCQGVFWKINTLTIKPFFQVYMPRINLV